MEFHPTEGDTTCSLTASRPLPAVVEHVVDDVPGEHVLVDVSLHDEQHITQPARQPSPLSASRHINREMCTDVYTEAYRGENIISNILYAWLMDAVTSFVCIFIFTTVEKRIQTHFKIAVSYIQTYTRAHTQK